MKFKRADNCGPVPYPDRSGRMLTDEIVEGDEWEVLIPLGFVVKVESQPGKRLPEPPRPTKQAKVKAIKPRKPRAVKVGDNMAKNAILDTSDNQPGDVDVLDERNGAGGVDKTETGGPGTEGSAG